jgi:hypothetical protein
VAAHLPIGRSHLAAFGVPVALDRLLEVPCPVLVKITATALAATLGFLALFFVATLTVLDTLIGDSGPLPSPHAEQCLPTGHGPVPGFRAEQVANAAAIVAVGAQLRVPPQGWLVALTAAITESGLRNLPYGDRDSLGLFQQRPSQGWGTSTQILNPRYSATQFYRHLLALPHWQQMTVNNAAQSVQRSATPTAYALHEPAARALLHTLSTGHQPDSGHTATNNSCPGSTPLPCPAGPTPPTTTPATAHGPAVSDCSPPTSGAPGPRTHTARPEHPP